MKLRLAAAVGGLIALAGGAAVESLLSEQAVLDLNASYRAASYGDVITVPSGTHAGQSIYFQAAKGSEADEADVVIRGEPGAVVQGITMYGVRHLTIENLTIQGAVIYECEDSGVPTEARGQHPVDNTLRNSRVIGTTRSENANRLIVAGNEIGPSSAVIKVGASGDTAGGNCTDEPPSDISFLDNDVHNFREAAAASHMECFFIEGVRGFVMERNIVRGCSVFSVFFKQQLAAGAFGMQDIRICNNWLGYPVSSQFRVNTTGDSISFSEGSYSNLTLCNNSIEGDLLLRTDLPTSWANVSVRNNIARAPQFDCGRAGITVSGNAWLGSQRCPNDAGSGISPGWADSTTPAEIASPTSDPVIDLHLTTGAWPIDRVPSGDPSDFDGDSRPQGPAHDIGADEVRAVVEPPPTTTEPPPTTTEPTPACPGSSLELRVLSETPSTITLGWDAVPGADGYRFSRSDQSKRPHTWDSSRTSVTFSKGAECYRVQALDVIADGGHP